MYDRPNLNDQITSATLSFSDGTSVNVGALQNDGSATYVNLASPVTTSWLLFTITGVSATTGSAGLAEIQVFSAASGNSTSTSGSPTSTSSGATPTSTAALGVDLALTATAVASSQQDATSQVSGWTELAPSSVLTFSSWCRLLPRRSTASLTGTKRMDQGSIRKRCARCSLLEFSSAC